MNSLTVFLHKWLNDVCWMSDFLLKAYWNATYTTMSIYCPMQSYPHNHLLRKRHHDASYLLTLLVSNLRLNVTNTTISNCCPTQSWLHNPSLHKRQNNTSYSLSFHGYAVTLVHQGLLYFVHRCLALYSSSPSADPSIWSLIYTLCVRSISVYLLRLNFLGNEWV